MLLPIAPFTETSGSFVNAEGRLQSFHAVVRPLGDTRPAWKVLRVLGNLLGLPGFDADTSQAVLAAALPGVASGTVVDATRLNNADASVGPAAAAESPREDPPEAPPLLGSLPHAESMSAPAARTAAIAAPGRWNVTRGPP